MAIIKCKKCEKDFSDTLSVCPHCGYESILVYCPECNSVNFKNHNKCEKCGFEFTFANMVDLTIEETEKFFDQIVEEFNENKDNNEIIKICYEKIKLFENFGNKKHIIDECKIEYEKVVLEEEQSAIYDELITKVDNSKTLKELNNDLKAFEKISEYKDSSDYIENLREKITAIKSRIKKKIIKISAIISSLIILVVLAVFLIVPGTKYLLANSNFKNGNFEKATELYVSAGEFLDSVEKSIISKKAENYTKGNNFYKNKNYYEALKAFIDAKDYKDAKKLAISSLDFLVEEKEFAKTFNLLSGCSGELEIYKQYFSGMNFYSAGEFSKAIECFNNSENLYNSKEMINACKLMNAEEYISTGSLNKAKDLYSKLPKDFKWNGISVSEKLKFFEKYKEYVSMCGKWRASGKNTAKVTQKYKSTGSWDAWTTDYENSYQFIDVYCIINKDGSVTLKGSAEYTYHTDYSSLSAYLKPKQTTVYINEKINGVPNSLKVSNYLTLSFVDGKWKLRHYNYSENESISFSYIYESNYTYGNKISKN